MEQLPLQWSSSFIITLLRVFRQSMLRHLMWITQRLPNTFMETHFTTRLQSVQLLTFTTFRQTENVTQLVQLWLILLTRAQILAFRVILLVEPAVQDTWLINVWLATQITEFLTIQRLNAIAPSKLTTIWQIWHVPLVIQVDWVVQLLHLTVAKHVILL